MRDTFLAGLGEMHTAIRDFNWSATAVGPIASWSNSLRNIVNLVVNTRHPMFLWWGTDLVQFYNDAYRPSLGADRHPAALGARGREFWTEIWHTIGPQIEGVMERGDSTWNEDHLVPIHRNGRMEEVYWTYGYSPVWDDDGTVCGTLVVVQEQTARVLSARRVKTVRDLASTASMHSTEEGAWLAAFDVLSANPHDVPWAMGYALSADGTTVRIVAERPLELVQKQQLSVEVDSASVVGRIIESGKPQTVTELHALAGTVIVPPWPETVTSARLIPIRRPRSPVPFGILAVGLSPRLPFDDEYADFLTMAADQLANAIANARAHEEERRHLAAVSDVSDRFRDLLERAPAGVAVFAGSDHRFELANPIYRAITHRPNPIGQTFAEVFPELGGSALPGILDRVYATGVPFVVYEYRVDLESAAGRLDEVYFSFRLAPLRRESGGIAGLIVVAVEVTDQVRARRELQHAQEQLDFTLHAAGVGQWELNMVTGIATCSDRHHQIFARDAPYGPWTYEMFMAHVAESDRSRVASVVSQAVATGADLDFECPIVTMAGTRRWIHVYGRVDKNRGTPVGLLGIVHDVTERRDLLEREREARRNAEHASHAKDQFLATLSHELRTPMNTIVGWTDLLSQGGLSPADVQEGLATVQRHAQAQARMIEDLLDMGRIVSGEIHVTARRVRLDEVIGHAIDAVAHAASAKDVAVVARVAEEGFVEADAGLIQQIFWNLLGNAVKFTAPGGTVTVTLERRGPALVVTVADTGEGIAPKFLPHVFDRFRQEDGSSTRAHRGLGIGLSIVKQLVEAHGGTVAAASGGRGQGATFTVVLPEAPSGGSAPTATRADDSPPAPLVREPDGRLVGTRILVVEDDPDTRDLIGRILTAGQATVVTAGSAADALLALAHHQFDLLVSDIGMPHQDGYELIRRVRALDAAGGGAIPAVALTAYGRPEDRKRARASGFQVHLSKPIQQLALLHACASLLGR